MITASQYHDSNIEDIRSQLNAKQDGIPFLLLPVKIETRFMQVDRALEEEEDTYSDILQQLFELVDYINFEPAKLPEHEVLGKIRRLNREVEEIEESLDEIRRLSPQNKQYLIDKSRELQRGFNILSPKLSKLRWPDVQLLKALRGLKTSLERKLFVLVRSIQNLPSKGSRLLESNTFLDNFGKFNKSLEQIGKQEIGSTDRKEKREYFAFLDGQISAMNQGLKHLNQDLNTNMQATQGQLNKLDQLIETFPQLCESATANLRNLKSTYKRAEYQEKLAQIEQQALAIHQQYENRLKRKIHMKLELKTAEAREVLWQINGIRYDLKKQNRHPFKTYEEIRAKRTQLYKKLHALRSDIHKVVEGTQKERKAISEAWDATDAELVKFTERVKSYKGRDLQKSGQTRTITHINKEYRRDLSGLKSGTKSYFSSLDNTRLEKSASSLHTAIKTLTSLKDEMESITQPSSSDLLQSALNKLVDSTDSFEAIARDIHILPQKDFQALQELAERIVGQTERLTAGGNAPRALSLKSTQAAQQIQRVVQAQYSDATDRKDRFYDENRNPFVFATRTRTVDELWVRFYPDDIAIHTHEDKLTEDEVEAGKTYWQEIWAANDAYEIKLAAWRAISTSYGSQRAAWIVRSLDPGPVRTNELQDRFQAYSTQTLNLISILSKISSFLGNSYNDEADPLAAIGTIYPLLLDSHEIISQIEKDSILLLERVQRILLKLQSQIAQLLKDIDRMVQEIGRNDTNLETVNRVIYLFNQIVKLFGGIKKINSKEVIEEVSETGIFPELETKAASWTMVPHSKVMPDRFVVLTVRNGQYKHLILGESLPMDYLTVGLDPDSFDEDIFLHDADGNLEVPESIKWMTDFEEAKAKGMAVCIPLEEEDLRKGFDKVFVLGIKDTSATEGKLLLEQLLDNHHYLPEGASFLPVGTPTNNTEAGKSGFRSLEDPTLSFAIERHNETELAPSDPDFPTDAERLANGLGINLDVLDNLDYHDRTEVSEALNMNHALFHGTIGNYMEEGLDTLFTLGNINHTKAFFSQYVSARGFLPCLRVGTQPYGILPTTAFSRFHVSADDSFLPQLNKDDFDNPAVIEQDLQIRYDIRLKELLNSCDHLWSSIRLNKVAHAGNTDENDPQAHFMEMLGLQANSEDFFYRYALNVASRQAVEGEEDFSFAFDNTKPWSPTHVASTFRPFINKGYFFSSDYFRDEQQPFPSGEAQDNAKNSRISEQFSKARIFANRHLQDQAQLIGDIIDNRELADTLLAASNPNSGTAEERAAARAELDNFIDWLVNQNPWDIHAQNRFSEVVGENLKPGMPSKSLLFLLLRHSLLSAYADTILKILEYEGLTDQKTRKKMGQPAHYYNRFRNSFHYVTKWTYLFSKIGPLDGVLGYHMNRANGFFAYMYGRRHTSSGYLNRYISPENRNIFTGYSGHTQHQPMLDEVDKTRAAISKLKEIPTARLDQLLREHLDLCTYRLDAWRLGLVNKRLSEQRINHPAGIYFGAYGWVEDLRKGGERALAENIPESLWQQGDLPVYTDEDNLGFIHSPSINHAITAAILRAGFHANEATAEIDNQMAVNLSSMRVRMALNLLNGIRSGQDPAAILGYQFERGLHERYLHIPLELDQFIYDFRDEFPLSIPITATPPGQTDIPLSNVVNGLELLEEAQQFIEDSGGPPNPGDSLYQSLKAHENAWWTHLNIENISDNANAAQRDAMLKEIDRMADAFDALGDLCMSESVYQVVRGNHIRASAIMDKLAKGDVPNDIEIADTPRTGTVVTHKVGMFFESIRGIDHVLTETGPNSQPVSDSDLDAAVLAANAAAPGWTSRFSPRAIAEPSLNKWIGHMIGDPAFVKCRVEYTFAEVVHAVTVRLSDLQIQPMDALHLFGTGSLNGGAELNARIANYVRSTLALPGDFDGTADDVPIRITYTQRDAGWSSSDISFYEKAAYIQSLRQLLTQSAVLAADALHIPGEEEILPNEIRNQDVEEYLIRISNLKARLEGLKEQYLQFFTDEVSPDAETDHDFTGAQITSLRSLLLHAAEFGIQGTIPEHQFAVDNNAGNTLLDAADGAAKAIQSRLKQADKLMPRANDTSLENDVRVNAMQEMSKNLLGPAFIMLPHFFVRNHTALGDQLGLEKENSIMRASGSLVMDQWSQGVARVRERMATLDTIQMWAENFDVSFPELKAVQLPFALDGSGVAVDHWLGTSFPTDYTPTEDKLSLVLINSSEMVQNPTESKVALLLDEWVEIIPSLIETTGVAFQYDQPDAKPPNTLLLAVSPQLTGHWAWDDLVYTLDDTLQLAKNRAVEPEHLEDSVFGHILPGIMNEIVPPQLQPSDPDATDAQDNPLGLQVVTDFGAVNPNPEPETDE